MNHSKLQQPPRRQNPRAGRGGLANAVKAVLAGSAFVALACCFMGCQTPAQMTANSDTADPAVSGTLREGDVIQLTFAVSTNLNTVQRIPLDGQISLQYVGKVQAAGKTTTELEKSLEKLYQPQLRGTEPITVTLISGAAGVYITGAVLRPGKIPLERPMTVLDAIMEAGGVDHSRAKLSGVTVLRVENGQRVAHHINVKRALDGKDPSLFYLKPFDIVYVPEKMLNF
jgi:polysaccharide export outer membrane protein